MEENKIENQPQTNPSATEPTASLDQEPTDIDEKSNEIKIRVEHFNEWFEIKLKNKYKRGLEGIKLRFNQVFSVVR